MIRYLNIALAVAIPLIVVVKVYHINKITSFDIDRLDKQLTPFKSFIKPGSRVGYDVHTKYGGIFMAVEHVMVPTLLSLDMTADSMIVLRDKNDTLKTFPKYRIISQNTDKDRIAELIEKIK
jgi:hypothetical protein